MPQVLVIDSELLKLLVQFDGAFEPSLCLFEPPGDTGIAREVKLAMCASSSAKGISGKS
jgi:hypothetical protein